MLRKSFYYAIIIAFIIVIIQFTSPVYHFTLLLLGKRSHVNSNYTLSVTNTPNSAVASLFKVKPLVMWSNDYHIAPINDLKHLLKPLGVNFIDKSLSGHCHITNTCGGRDTLRVINRDNAYNLNPDLIPKFYEQYKNDAEMQTVDAFGCFLPPAMCELFEPFNRSLIIVVPTRYEAGRFGKERWIKWNENLVRYHKDPKNVVAGNNLYDVEYVKYFTGIQPVLLPSFCGYITASYEPTRPGFLVAPIHHGGLSKIFFEQIAANCPPSNCSLNVTALRSKYPSYKYTDLTAHQGMIYVPYQVSVMSFFEQYRMNIPLFCPSVNLLSSWQLKHMVMNERTWSGVHGKRPARSDIDPHPSQMHLPDPNNEQNETAIQYWVKFADYYQLPHVTYYDSIEHLVQILTAIKPSQLLETSKLMRQYNAMAKRDLTNKWTEILTRVANYSKNSPH